MKIRTILGLLSLLVLSVAPISVAQEAGTDNAKEETGSEKKQKTVLSKARKLKPRYGKLPKSAKYLMLINLSTEDDGAKDFLKELDDELSTLKSDKVAPLILCSDESTKKLAKALKSAKMKVPTVFASALPEGVEEISDYLPETSADITLLDMGGDEICSGDYELLTTWKDEVKKQETLKNWETLQIDEKRYPVAAALKGISAPTFGTFDPEADYFVYLFSASWCVPCKRLMPDIASKIYPEMRKTKKPNVEIILVGGDSTPEGVRSYRDHYKAEFFALCSSSPGVSSLPGLTTPESIPHCIFVDKTGKVLHQGYAGCLSNWKNIVGNAK